MILLAFLLPLAFYLLVLGSINRRRRPLLVSGVWDFVGLLFAASGFLLFGGPAVLSSLSERWRRRWLLGQAGGEVGEGLYEFWVFLSALYFVAVVAGAAWLLWRQRHLTAVYNVPRDLLEEALGRACERLGLNPVRSGNLFLFGPSFEATVGRWRPGPEAIQAPHHRPVAVQPLAEEHLAPAKGVGPPAEHLLGQTAVLEVDPFPSLRHATLRWDPADSPLRQEVEAELSRVLDRTPVPDHGLGLWLTLLGLALLGVVLAGGVLLFVLSLLMR